MRRPLGLILLGFLLSAPAAALAAGPERTAEDPAAQAEPHGILEEHEHANALSLFLGGTTETEEQETYFTLGLEYERTLGRRFALQLVAEHVSDKDAWVFAAPLLYRPVGELHFIAGPGFETAPRRPESGHDSAEAEAPHDAREASFLLRFGVGYKLKLGKRLEVFPNVDLDLVREHGEWVKAVVFGVSVGFGF